MKIVILKKAWLIPLVLFIVPVLIYLLPFVIQQLWGWIIPDLFPQGVVTGLVASKISWGTAGKIFLAIAFVGLILRATTMQTEKE